MTLRARSLAFGLGVVLLTGIVGADANAAVLCRKRSGRVVVAESCAKKESLLAATDLGLVGPAGSPGAAGAPGETGMIPYRVVDAAAHQIGVVLSFLGDTAQVVLTQAPLTVPVQVAVAFGEIAPGILMDAAYYASADCSGAPFMRETGSLLPRAQLLGDVLYYATEARARHDFASIEVEDATCSGGTPTARGTCCRAQSQTLLAAPATAVVFASLGIVPPLSVEVRP